MSKAVKERKRQQRAVKEIDRRVNYKIERQKMFEGEQEYELRQAMLQRQLTVDYGKLYK